MTSEKPAVTVRLVGPRGFCAGVVRAIRIVEAALERYGAPVYVRHEIVHNRSVVKTLEEKGAVFVEELNEVPDDAPVIFSAHGVPKSVPEEAGRRSLHYIDATCPLVSKIHREAERHFAAKRHIFLIGHAGHPEVVGTMGQLPGGAIELIQTVQDARRVEPPAGRELAYVTQTTLSVDDTAEIIEALRSRFPGLHEPKREDICYATTNRQAAVKAAVPGADAAIVIGSRNSSNSNRLVEVAKAAGCRRAFLADGVAQIDWDALADIRVLTVTAGASAPEALVEEVVQACRERFDVTVEDWVDTLETVKFKLPRGLAA